MSLDTKTKSILTQAHNQVIFDSHTKPSQFRNLHWNQVNSDPPHRNQVFSTTHTTTKSILMSTLKPCHFLPVSFCVLYVQGHVPVIQQQNTYHIKLSTNSYCSWRAHTRVKPQKYWVSIHPIIYSLLLIRGIYMTTYDTGGRISLRSIPLGIYTTAYDTGDGTSYRSITPEGSIYWCHTVYSS